MAMIFIAIAILGLAVSFWFSANQTISHQSEKLASACGQIEKEVAQLFPSNDSRQVRVGNPDLLQQQMYRVTSTMSGTEGGFWHINSKFFGYSFPTYLGNDIKSDVPEAEKTLLSSLAQRSLEQRQVALSVQRNDSNALIGVACPVTTHEGLSAWLMQRTSLVPLSYTLLSVGLFSIILVLSVISLTRTIVFERSWYSERDRLVKQAEDETKPIPVTSNINEIQPLLMLLYQSRQKRINLERSITSLEAKLSRNHELSVVARLATSLARELQLRLKATNADNKETVLEQIQQLLHSFINLDLRHRSHSGAEQINVKDWLEQVASYHQHNSAGDQQSISAICTEDLILEQNYLLLRYAVDVFIMQAVTFGPKHGEVLLKANERDNMLIIEIIDESEGLTKDEERRMFRQDDVLPELYGKGLKPVRDALQSIGAEVSYQADGENSRFILQIPMTSD
ncbi:MAG: hypothetical protein ACQEQ8_02710 [Pseudomonadota bacterium]